MLVRRACTTHTQIPTTNPLVSAALAWDMVWWVGEEWCKNNGRLCSSFVAE